MKKILAIVLSLVMVMALVAGCGSSNSGSTTTTTTTTTTTEPTTTTEATTETMGTANVDLSKYDGYYTEDSAKLTGLAGAEITLVVGDTTPLTGAYNQGLLVMKDLLEAYSNGTMTLDIHTDSQLGGERDMTESVGMGSLDMLATSTGPLGNFVSDMYSVDLPYLFQNSDEAFATLDGSIGRGLLDQFAAQGIYAVNFWQNGWRCTSNNKRELVHPEDIKGLKIRTMENSIHMATYNAWGAYATPMAMGEVFTACQQGTIDGQENPLQIINSNKLQEVQPYISENNVFYSPAVLMINKDLYDGFTDFQKACFDKAATEAQTWERNYCIACNDAERAMIEADGAKVTQVDIAEWAASEGVATVYAKAAEYGANADLIAEIQKSLGR